MSREGQQHRWGQQDRKKVREVDLNPPEGWCIQETRVEHLLCPSSVDDIPFGGGQPGAPKGWEEAVSSL